MEKEEDLRFDEWYNFRVVESLGKFYIQREYMVTGYHPDGRYDPCIATSWNTFCDVKERYNEPIVFTEIAFETLRDVLKYWKNSKRKDLLYSSSYQIKDLPDFKYICMRDDLMKEYPEALI